MYVCMYVPKSCVVLTSNFHQILNHVPPHPVLTRLSVRLSSPCFRPSLDPCYTNASGGMDGYAPPPPVKTEPTVYSEAISNSTSPGAPVILPSLSSKRITPCGR